MRAERTRRHDGTAARGLIGIALIGLLAGCSSGTAGTTPEPTSTAAAATAAAGTTECAPAAGAGTPVLEFDAPFAMCIDPARTYTATFETTEGTVVVQLDPGRSPIAVNNFVNLARSGYFDGTDLFRTEARTGIIQGGSPHTQNNRDPGPGYTIPDDPLPFSSSDYAPGVIAMANSGPDSGGGQFFFVSQPAGSYLGDPGQIGDSAGTYVVFGRTVDGLDVLQSISALESAPGAAVPSRPVTVESVTITES
jgi:peptidylprolyl isomerase